MCIVHNMYNINEGRIYKIYITRRIIQICHKFTDVNNIYTNKLTICIDCCISGAYIIFIVDNTVNFKVFRRILATFSDLVVSPLYQSSSIHAEIILINY